MNNPTRSKLGGHWAGTGIEHALYESHEQYYDRRPGFVKLPNDLQAKNDVHSLAGPVVTYFIDKAGNRIERGWSNDVEKGALYEKGPSN